MSSTFSPDNTRLGLSSGFILETPSLISGTCLALQLFEFEVPALCVPCGLFSWKSCCILWRMLSRSTMGLSAAQQTPETSLSALQPGNLSAVWMKDLLTSQRLHPSPLSHTPFPFYFWKTLGSLVGLRFCRYRPGV